MDPTPAEAPTTPTVALTQPLAPAPDAGFGDSLADFFNGVEATPAATPAPVEIAPEPAEIAPEPAAEGAEKPSKTKKATEKPAEKDPLAELDEFEDTRDWTAQAGRRFKEIKAEAKAHAARVAELEATVQAKEARLAELEALTTDPSHQATQEKLAEYEKTLLLTNLERTQAYQAAVAAPLAKLVGDVDDVAARNGLDADALLDVLSLEDAQAQEERITELLATASERDRYRIFKASEEIKPILAQRAALQSNVQAALAEAAQLETAQKQAETVARVQQRQAAATSVAEKLASRMAFLTTLEGVDMAALSKAAAEIDPSALDPVTGTYHAMAAKLLPKLATGYVRLQAELGHLTDKLAEYDKATPRAGGGSVPNSGPLGAVDGKSFLEAVGAAFG